eukprot:gene22317-28435_t
MLTIFNRHASQNDQIRIRGFYGDQVIKSRSYKENILICTIEKANGILNSLIQRGYGDSIGCVVLDEMHVLGNTFNGYLLEILISKLRFYEYKSNLRNSLHQPPNNNHSPLPKHIQIIAMSATMGNVTQLATWLGAKLYITTFRPVPLTERIKAEGSILHRSVMNGVAYHHAGLSAVERSAIETAYRGGVVSVLCATSTLAAGVNLPAGCVLIRSMNIGRDYLDIVQYRQMCGRAGRAGQALSGESTLLVKAVERERALMLSNSVMPNVASQLHPDRDGGNGLMKACLEIVGLGLVTSVVDFQAYVERTLLFAQLTRFGRAMMRSSLHPDEGIVMYESLLSAQERGMNLENNLHLLYLVTPLEHRIAPNFKKLLSIYEHAVHGGKKTTKSTSTNSTNSTSGAAHASPIYTLYTSIGIDLGTLSRWQYQAPNAGEVELCSQAVKLYSLYKDVVGATDKTDSTTAATSTSAGARRPPQLNSAARSSLSKQDWKVLSHCKRLWAAMALNSLLEGRPVHLVASDLGVDTAEVETLRKNAKIMCSKVTKFCDEIGWSPLSRMVTSFAPLLDVDSPKELLSLLTIPNMTRKIALVLVQNGITTAEVFAAAGERSAASVAQMLQLSIGFEMQDIDELEVRLERQEGDCEKKSDNGEDGVQTAATVEKDTTSSVKSKTRDEELRFRLHSLVVALVRNAVDLLDRTARVKDQKAAAFMSALTTVETTTSAVSSTISKTQSTSVISSTTVCTAVKAPLQPAAPKTPAPPPKVDAQEIDSPFIQDRNADSSSDSGSGSETESSASGSDSGSDKSEKRSDKSDDSDKGSESDGSEDSMEGSYRHRSDQQLLARLSLACREESGAVDKGEVYKMSSNGDSGGGGGGKGRRGVPLSVSKSSDRVVGPFTSSSKTVLGVQSANRLKTPTSSKRANSRVTMSDKQLSIQEVESSIATVAAQTETSATVVESTLTTTTTSRALNLPPSHAHASAKHGPFSASRHGHNIISSTNTTLNEEENEEGGHSPAAKMAKFGEHNTTTNNNYNNNAAYNFNMYEPDSPVCEETYYNQGGEESMVLIPDLNTTNNSDTVHSVENYNYNHKEVTTKVTADSSFTASSNNTTLNNRTVGNIVSYSYQRSSVMQNQPPRGGARGSAFNHHMEDIRSPITNGHTNSVVYSMYSVNDKGNAYVHTPGSEHRQPSPSYSPEMEEYQQQSDFDTTLTHNTNMNTAYHSAYDNTTPYHANITNIINNNNSNDTNNSSAYHSTSLTLTDAELVCMMEELEARGMVLAAANKSSRESERESESELANKPEGEEVRSE